MKNNETITKDVRGTKYIVVRNRKEIHDNYQLHVKKQLRASNHSTIRWLERVGKGDFQRGVASSFKLILLKKVLLKEDGTRIYVSHKDVAFIVAPDEIGKKDYVVITILTKEDVASNPSKSWWFD